MYRAEVSLHSVSRHATCMHVHVYVYSLAANITASKVLSPTL